MIDRQGRTKRDRARILPRYYYRLLVISWLLFVLFCFAMALLLWSPVSEAGHSGPTRRVLASATASDEWLRRSAGRVGKPIADANSGSRDGSSVGLWNNFYWTYILENGFSGNTDSTHENLMDIPVRQRVYSRSLKQTG